MTYRVFPIEGGIRVNAYRGGDVRGVDIPHGRMADGLKVLREMTKGWL